MANYLKVPPFHLFFALFSHPFYTFFTRIFEQSGLPVKGRLLHLLECLALLFALVRLVTLAIQLNLDSQFTGDPMAQYFATQLHLYDRYMLACQVASNQQIISFAILYSFLLHAPTNIYLIYRLVYRPILLIEISVLLVFTFAQLICLACSLVPLALANGALYQTGKYLPGVQLSVLRGQRCRSLKFKYEILQSTLSESRVKSGASFGPICLITFVYCQPIVGFNLKNLSISLNG